MVTKLSLSCLLVNKMFVCRRQSQSRPSQWRNGRSTSRSQDGHLSKTVMSEARRQLSSRPRNGHRYLSSGCTIYPKRLLDMVQGFIADLQNPTNQSHSRNSQFFSERTRPWVKSLQGIQRGTHCWLTSGALDQVRGWVERSEMRAALDQSSTHLLVTS